MRKSLPLIATAVTLALLLAPAAATAATFYLRPNGYLTTSKPWMVVGAPTAWEALDDEVNEFETPTNTDSIEVTQGGRETRAALSSMNILGVSITKAQIWYYAGQQRTL